VALLIRYNLCMAGLSKLKQTIRPLRETLQFARLPDETASADIGNAAKLLRGRIGSQVKVRLRFNNQYAYKFRYLHRGLTQLAGQCHIDYLFAIDKSLGRKTAVIEYVASNGDPATAVIDGSARSWELGQPDLNFDSVFGDQNRVVFKVEYGLSNIHEMPSDEGAPPIGALYNQVIDGAYWPINAPFLNERWVKKQQQRNSNYEYDLMAAYGLQPEDLVPNEHYGGREQSERVRFLFAVETLKQNANLNVLVNVRIKPQHRDTIGEENIPTDVKELTTEAFFPFDEYVERICRAHLQYCPKSVWHTVAEELTAQRTYRVLETLMLGQIPLSSPVQFHFDFLPGSHYIPIKPDLSDLESVVHDAVSEPEKLAAIRGNIIKLYDSHLSPLAIARYYVNKLHALSVGDIPLIGWEIR